jgi:hypothetical protein
MFECPCCTTLFPTLPESGGCPRCGYPHPTELHPQVVEKIVREYVYIEKPQAISYYVPSYHHPIQRVRANWFSTLGYRAGTAILVILVIAFIVWQVYVAFFTHATRVVPSGQIPTVQAEKPFVEPTKMPFSQFRFFSAKDSEDLRSQQNVINVAVLGVGFGARYMTDYAVSLDKSWKKVNQIIGVNGFTPAESTFTLKVDTSTYVLNKFQGFILAERPIRIYLVDGDSNIWENAYSDQLLLPIADAQATLSASIPVNPYLSLTLK